jgi:hypothetical protein
MKWNKITIQKLDKNVMLYRHNLGEAIFVPEPIVVNFQCPAIFARRQRKEM